MFLVFSHRFSFDEGGEHESDSSSELLPSFPFHSIICYSLLPYAPPLPPALCRYLLPLLHITFVRVNRIYLPRVVLCSATEVISLFFCLSVPLPHVCCSLYCSLSLPLLPRIVSHSSEHLSFVLLLLFRLIVSPT